MTRLALEWGQPYQIIRDQIATAFKIEPSHLLPTVTHSEVRPPKVYIHSSYQAAKFYFLLINDSESTSVAVSLSVHSKGSLEEITKSYKPSASGVVLLKVCSPMSTWY